MRFFFLFLIFIKICNAFNKNLATTIVHGNYICDNNTGNIIPSISLGTTFIQEIPGINLGIDDVNSHGFGYIYSRLGNPTRGEFERHVSLLENASFACAFSSGMASISAIINLLKPNDHVIAMDNLYGGTMNFFDSIASKSNGIEFSFVNCNNLKLLEKLIKPNTKLIWIEALSNPLLKTVDIKAIAKIAKKNNCLLVVDSTFANPYLLNALNLGADIVIHSGTKFISGHSDVIIGIALCNDMSIYKKLRNIQIHNGAVPSPFDCYLAIRGLKTLHLRTEASQKNAIQLAKFLESNDEIEKVLYPELKSYDNYKLIKKQFKGSGSIISFYIKGNVEKFLSSLKIFKLAVSLGSVESLICSPILMTHINISKDKRECLGITDKLIRMSVGIEDIDDLINDLKNALKESKK